MSYCRELFEEVAIHANGNVVCSCQDPRENKVLGNVNTTSLHDIFHGEAYRKLRSEVLAYGSGTHCVPHGIQCPFKVMAHERGDAAPEVLPIAKIRMETISHCNLRCPACVVTDWYAEPNPDGGPNERFTRLPLEVSKRVLDEAGTSLRQLWLYDYGEPFLDRTLLDVCRHARKVNPATFLYTHTNATVVPEGWPETIVREGLFHMISFSIDGATQESYERYRVRGVLQKALDALGAFVAAKRSLGAEWPRLIWQYILFEWNDSPQELQRAQAMAADLGVEMQWIVTHTAGRSQRVLADSEEYLRLTGVHHYSGQMLAERADKT